MPGHGIVDADDPVFTERGNQAEREMFFHGRENSRAMELIDTVQTLSFTATVMLGA
ncbi:hypothetical protein PSCICL_33580 [Pseudomonas cichorii]|nr:hypothetical protein PSCICE_21120 [Pseudomonas cichorii]GFM58805.1 hypothetical protein PSCICF_49830 [Pseudomonas cichorii]GFM63836.1 hypothetical protein PSCICG_49960 [Pseudomonas cichorii]GFM72366.1 hypothetical protein PSCICL_33580 [Pseudomonas cichorii]